MPTYHATVNGQPCSVYAVDVFSALQIIEHTHGGKDVRITIQTEGYTEPDETGFSVSITLCFWSMLAFILYQAFR